jgi:nucleoside-diphosphate-sugar epimerase
MPVSDFSGKTLLLAGGNGFIGRHVARAAAAAGFREVVVIGRTRGVQSPESGVLPGVQLATLDLLDPAATAAFFRARSFDFLINLAGKIDHANTPGIYCRQLEINLHTTLNLADATHGRVGRFIQVGSGMEYGTAPCPQTPDGPAAPASAYGVAKLAASQLILARARSEDFPGLVARPFTVYGPGQPDASFLAAALAAARAGGNFPTTPGGQTRDFVPVEKVAAELLALCSLPADAAHGRVFNLCTGVELSLRRVLELLQEIYPAFSPALGAIPYRPTELMRSAGLPFIPWTPEQTESALRQFFAAVR